MDVQESPLNSEQKFAVQVLSTWEKITGLSEKHRKMGTEDWDNFKEYSSALCTLWGNLKTEVDELKNADEFIATYDSYSEYYYNISALEYDTVDDPEAIFRFEMVVKMAIKKLGFTTRTEGKRL
jgi:hypothetical protein